MNLKNKIIKLIKKTVYREKYSSETYIKYLRSLGMRIGEDTVIFSPTRTTIDGTRPWLIKIGKNVQITEGVTILTHGYDWSVLKSVYGEVLGSSGGVSIGDNVFIGMKTTILKGVTVGNNVIIGANSLVNKDIPDNCVVAGNPAKVIMSLDEYYKKRVAAQEDEAIELVRLYREVYKKDPDERALHEFFYLFSDGENLPDCWDHMLQLGGNYDISLNHLKNKEKRYKDMGDFLDKID